MSETEPNLYRVVFTPEGMEGWDVYVIAGSLGDAVEIATDEKTYRIGQPLTVTMLPVLVRDADDLPTPSPQ